MKTKNIFFSLSLFVFLAFNFPVTAGEMKETKEVYSFERIIKPTTQICFENKVGSLKVETWEKNSVKVDLFVIADGDNDEVQKVLEFLKKMKFIQDGDKVTFDTRFYKSMQGQIPGHFKVMLLDGSTVKLTRLEIAFVLTMPKNNPFYLNQAYENATLPDLNGTITLDLYECELVAGQLPNCQQITMKYGKGTIDSVFTVNLNLYENKLTLKHAGSVTLGSKYSEIDINNAGSLNIDSYEDKLTVLKHDDLIIKAKYTEFTLADFNKATFDLYECQVKARIGNIIAIGAKYCELEFNTCRAIVFTDSYENKFTSEIVGNIKANSSYGTYKIYRLDGNLNFLNSYEDEIEIREVGKKFTGISMNSKYSELELFFETGTAYKLDADLEYTNLDFPKSDFREIRYHKEDDKFQYTGVTHDSDENTVPQVKLQMYEGVIKLK